jgi:hypothetical protein
LYHRGYNYALVVGGVFYKIKSRPHPAEAESISPRNPDLHDPSTAR